MTVERLDHVLVLTNDVEGTTTFYCDVLGFERGDRPPLPFHGHWLYLAGRACVHVADRAAYEAHAASMGLPPTGAAIDHVAFAATGYDELAARLESSGVDSVTNDVPEAAIRQIFLSDPNGIRIELNVT